MRIRSIGITLSISKEFIILENNYNIYRNNLKSTYSVLIEVIYVPAKPKLETFVNPFSRSSSEILRHDRRKSLRF